MLDLDELEAKAKAAGTTWVKDGAWAEICVQTAEVLDLIRELREARARIAMVLEWFGRESSIIYELSESIRVDIAQAAAAEREACADAESDAGRLALELECLLLSISDMPAVSRWWESANEALDLHRSRLDAIRARGEKGGE